MTAGGTMKQCKTCQHFQEERGECRLNPPIFISGFAAYWSFPKVTPVEWCSHWVPSVQLVENMLQDQRH